ncbi:MAG: MJ0042-type zinc finger domain-containing protein [Gemmataceae bacterium]
MLTKKLVCPSCGVSLKVADSLPAGKVVKCPRCGDSLRVPGDANGYRSSKPAGARTRKAAQPDYDDDLDHDDEEEEERPVKRKKFRKKKKPASRTPLIVGLVMGGAVLVGVGIILAAVFWPKNKGTTVAENSSSKSESEKKPEAGRGPGAPPGRPGPSRPEIGSANPGGARQGLAPGQSGQPSQGSAGGPPEGGGRGGGGPGGRNRGPDLSTVGRDPNDTVDWLMAFIREPTSKKPRSRMPGFEGKISEADLRSLAEYLASLK